jgi:nucleoside-diphosphate-sugar epimerase
MTREWEYSENDLEEISSLSSEFIGELSGCNVLVAGATGFIGSWIISALQHFNRYYSADIKIIGVSRNTNHRLTYLFPEVQFVPMDISRPQNISMQKPDCIFNAATPSTPLHGGGNPKEILDSAHLGTKYLINMGRGQNNCRFVNLSSGIVSKRKDDQVLNLESAKDSYLHGKRISEELVSSSDSLGEIHGRNLRLYTFAGPGISLVDHFAVGNFLKDALDKKAITIKGNPGTRRSYLYPIDLITNIFAATISNDKSVIEIGSRFSISMSELATLINSATGNRGIIQSEEHNEPDSYFPNGGNLLVDQQINLTESITRWIEWLEKR